MVKNMICSVVLWVVITPTHGGNSSIGLYVLHVPPLLVFSLPHEDLALHYLLHHQTSKSEVFMSPPLALQSGQVGFMLNQCLMHDSHPNNH